jgi:hypothetical protein
MDKHANTVPTETPCVKCGASSTTVVGGLPLCNACLGSHDSEKVASIYDQSNKSK